MLTVEAFRSRFFATKDDRVWLLQSYKTMQEAWEECNPSWCVWIATREGVLSKTELMKFKIICKDQINDIKDATWTTFSPESLAINHIAADYANNSAYIIKNSFEDKAKGQAAWLKARKEQAKWLRENTNPNFNLDKGE